MGSFGEAHTSSLAIPCPVHCTLALSKGNERQIANRTRRHSRCHDDRAAAGEAEATARIRRSPAQEAGDACGEPASRTCVAVAVLVPQESRLLTVAHELMAGAEQATRNGAQVDGAIEGDDATDSGATSSSAPKPHPPFLMPGGEAGQPGTSHFSLESSSEKARPCPSQSSALALPPPPIHSVT